MSGDTKTIINTENSSAMFYSTTVSKWIHGFLRQATKAGKKLLSRQSSQEGVSHAQNACMLLIPIQEL